jgi:hypothetical protein
MGMGTERIKASIVSWEALANPTGYSETESAFRLIPK